MSNGIALFLADLHVREQSNWCLTRTKEDLFAKRKRIFEVDPVASTAFVFALIRN